MSLSNVDEDGPLEDVDEDEPLEDGLYRETSEASIEDFSGTLESIIDDNPYPGGSGSRTVITMVQPELHGSVRRSSRFGGLGSSLVGGGYHNHPITPSHNHHVHVQGGGNGGNWRRGSLFDIGHGSQHAPPPPSHNLPRRGSLFDGGHGSRVQRAQRGSLIFDSDPRRRGSLLAFRPRTAQIPATNITAALHHHDNNKKKKHYEANGTEITDESDEDEDEEECSVSSTITANPSSSIGSLLMDTYSLMYIYPVCSAPYLYALFLFTFQFLVYALLLSSLLDMENTSNILHVPSSVSNGMRIAQGCAILIAVVNSVDVMVALNNLLRVPNAIIVVNDYDYGDNNNDDELNEATRGLLDNSRTVEGGGGGSRHSSSGEGGGGGASRHNSSELLGIQRGLAHGRSDISMRLKPLEVPCTAYPAGFKFKLANVLRGIEGSLSVMASFILIVQSSEIVAMFE